jgi:hypothetical protein
MVKRIMLELGILFPVGLASPGIVQSSVGKTGRSFVDNAVSEPYAQ